MKLESMLAEWKWGREKKRAEKRPFQKQINKHLTAHFPQGASGHPPKPKPHCLGCAISGARIPGEPAQQADGISTDLLSVL